MSHEKPARLTHSEEEDDSWVRLAEGSLEAKPASPERPEPIAEAPAPETSVKDEAALAEVKERLAVNRTAEEVPAPVEAVSMDKETAKAEDAPEADEFFKAVGAKKEAVESAERSRARGKSEAEIALSYLRQERRDGESVRKVATAISAITPAAVGVTAVFGSLGAQMTGLISHETFMAIGPSIQGVADLSAVAVPVLAGLAFFGIAGWNALKQSSHRKEWAKRFGRKLNAAEIRHGL